MTLEDTKRILVGEWVSVTPEVRPSATRNPDGTLKPFYLSRERGHADDRGLCGSPQLGGIGRVRAVAGRATSERFREDVRAVRPGRGPQLHGVRPDLCSGGLSVLGGKKRRRPRLRYRAEQADEPSDPIAAQTVGSREGHDDLSGRPAQGQAHS